MESFSIENIKSFEKNTNIELKPITILVGKNSCGKSSLLRFPVVMSQTFSSDTTSPLMFYGQLIDYGNYEDVVYKNKKESISFSIKQRMEIDDVQRTRHTGKETQQEFNKHDVEVKVSLNKYGKKVVIEKDEMIIDGLLCYGLYREAEGDYRINTYHFYNQETKEFCQEAYDIVVEETYNTDFFVTIDIEEVFDRILKKYFPQGIPELDKNVEGEDQLSYSELLKMSPSLRRLIMKRNKIVFSETEQITEYQHIANTFEFYAELLAAFFHICDVEMSLTSYIGPFRMNPQRIYRDEESQTRRVGVKGEKISTVLIRDSQKKRELIDKISIWLHKTMGYKLIVNDVNNGFYQILLEDDNGTKSNIIDVGYGISQILPVIAQVLVEPKLPEFEPDYNYDSLIIVEQPELHLHPAAQSELAELFVGGVIDCNKKMLIETHSEHFIRKLQVLVSDPNCKLTNEDVAIYYIDKDESGSAFAKELKILPNGKFAEKWPSGFFDKAHELSMELLKNSVS